MRKRRSLGPGFSDDWKDLLLPNFSYQPREYIGKTPWRLTSLYIAVLILFFLIFTRLFHLQIVEGKVNRELADGNRIQIRVIHAPRGVIFDRNGKILAANSPAFRLYDTDVKKARLISREEALELEVKNDPRALNLEVDNVRTYPLGEKTAHVIGYVGEISDAQLQEAQFKNYRQSDRIGQSGIEAQYEKILKGIDGGEIIEVDSFGRKLRSLRTNPPVPGQNIYLTIDADLQDQIYQQVSRSLLKAGSCCGAAVALDPNNGQILALLSFPSFDPNIFTNTLDEASISQIFSRSDSPILNRVIAGSYPPGSTFKIVTALAGLASGKITAETSFEDTGVMYLGSFKFSNWYFNQYGRFEGAVNLLKALQRSNDIYFYQVGRMVGENVLVDWGKKLNLGDQLGIDLPEEETGLLPTDSWKRETLGEVWFPGDTLHMAIGQGFVLTTPLQISGITSFIAADGTLYKPQLILDKSPEILVSNIASPDKVRLIKEGLNLVPKQGGTAWPLFTFPVATAGKTGTAEYGNPKGKTHAWYTGFAPADEPKIVMTVLIEGGGEGSSVASPIVKEAFRWYLSSDKNNLIKDIYTIATESAKILGE